MARDWSTEFARAVFATAIMAVAIGVPISFRGAGQFVALDTAAAKGRELVGSERMAAGGADRAGYSGLKLLASSPPSQVDKAVAAGSAEETFSDAQVAFDAASSELVMLGDTLKTANTRLAAAQAASDMADAQYQTAKTAHDMAMAAYDADPVNPDLGPALDEARLNLDEAVEQQVNLQNTVEKVSTAQASAVAAYNAAANDKSLAEAKLGEAQEQRAPIAASDQWTAVAGISNEANMAAVFDAVRDLLGL